MSIVTLSGELSIDANGTVKFQRRNGDVILRITHLQSPVPLGTHIIDMAAVAALLSYTPLPDNEEQPRMLGADDV